MQPDDLLDRLRSGDENAGAMLVSLCAPGLMAYARAIARDLSDADQEVICELAIERAIRKVDHFDESRGSFVRWLRGFVRHEASNWRRTRARLDELDEDPEACPDPGGDDEEVRRGRKQALSAMGELVKELSPTDQVIIDLRDRQQLPYAEIAVRTGASEEACRQRHLRARRRLRALAEANEAIVTYLRGARSSG
jgi:RNA polymerase sigma factor (sigma-70 family)